MTLPDLSGIMVSGWRISVSSPQERTAKTFVERHGLWSDEQFEAATRAERLIEEHGLEVVGCRFPTSTASCAARP